MAQSSVDWSPEFIPDQDVLYLAVPNLYLKVDNTHISKSCFKPKGEGLSTNWSKYATAQETRDQRSIPGNFGVLQMGVGAVRNVTHNDPLKVEHKPDPSRNNRAHSEIMGLRTTRSDLNEIRTALKSISKWAIIWQPEHLNQ